MEHHIDLMLSNPYCTGTAQRGRPNGSTWPKREENFSIPIPLERVWS